MPLASAPTVAADPGVPRTIRSGPTESAAPLPAITHAWAAAQPAGEQIVATTVARSMDRGWRAVVVVPDHPAWDHAAQCVADDDARVVRVALRGRHRALRSGRRRTAGLARWLAVGQIAIVHAHDDAAAATWRVATRRTRVPLVWDVDLDAPACRTDRACIAASSYLLTSGTGGRLGSRRQPPKRVMPRGPLPSADIVDDVYRCLTGVGGRPARHVIDLTETMPDGA